MVAMSLEVETDINKQFTEWAIAQGVKLNGIAVHRFPGRGCGIIAERKIKAGETILTVPVSALRIVQTVPKSISKPLGNISVHGILATDLTLDTTPARAPWRAIFPTSDDFASSIPLMWDPALQALLPPAAALLLENQRTKLALDWAAVSAAFPAIPHDLYLYNWLLVSTRTFYYTSPKIRPRKPLNRDDCMALSPLADLFNHADTGCNVTFSPGGYGIAAHRDVDAGEEVCISYGNHGDDFLLAEYGFILGEKNNRWDDIPLDDVLLPLFGAAQREILRGVGFLGRFRLDAVVGVCYRTKVALRLLCVPAGRWLRLVADGLDDEGDRYQVAVDGILVKALRLYLETVEETLRQVEALDLGDDVRREMLGRRWKQIRLLLTTSIDRIEK